MSMMNKGSEVSVGTTIKHDALLKHELLYIFIYIGQTHLTKKLQLGREKLVKTFKYQILFLAW